MNQVCAYLGDFGKFKAITTKEPARLTWASLHLRCSTLTEPELQVAKEHV